MADLDPIIWDTTEAERYRLAAAMKAIHSLRGELATAKTDTAVVDWLEQEADELAIFRDATKGKSVLLSYCSNASGCPLEIKRPTLREAVAAAIKANV